MLVKMMGAVVLVFSGSAGYSFDAYSRCTLDVDRCFIITMTDTNMRS